ncbi:putative UPF0481 protein At3g02645 [Macadamia integrifolia]|uniref:putative UPF0481 protein At3g02645 n=1 Tax=Macadamia integrifolia TaxID=60698 RepID=UPI001C4FF822|nr:putative UPF0481 protein At3g02645 [Macadamia integrifolia]
MAEETNMNSSQTATMTSNSNNGVVDEHRWVIQIRQMLEEELEDDAGFPVCIFNIPKTLLSVKPDCFIPHQIALGPYHHWREELYEMESHKVAAARRAQRQFQSLKFENLVEEMKKLMPKIRGCYNKYLDLSGEALAWMLAVDACFLLEFLQIYAIKEGKVQTEFHAGKNFSNYVMLRDIVMLENQIPLFLMRKVLELQHSSLEAADVTFIASLIGLCKEVSPFKMMNFSSIKFTEHSHLLDVLYHMIVPKSEEQPEFAIELVSDGLDVPTVDEIVEEIKDSTQVLDLIRNLLSKLTEGPVSHVTRVLISTPANFFSKLPGFSILKQPLELLFSKTKAEIISEYEDSSSTNNIHKPPLIEEIAIPSVTKLYNSGVQFAPIKGDITSITFDTKSFTLYLPTVTIDVNTEVILRNLVAYEASNASGPLIFTRYTELMNGIIDTKEDVKLLREKGIVLNHLKSDEEVANLWNGMSGSVRLTKVSFLDKVIEDVNKYYRGTWKVKVGNHLKKYVFGSWKFLTLLAAIFLLLVTTLQAFCSVYSCGSVLRIDSTIDQ